MAMSNKTKSCLSVLMSVYIQPRTYIHTHIYIHTYIQELQEAMAMSHKTKSSLSVLMSVSAATNKWLKRAGEGSEASTSIPGTQTTEGKPPPSTAPAAVSGDAKVQEKKQEEL